MNEHSIWFLEGGRKACSCGQQFPDSMAALSHALPLNTRELADAVAADPASTPEILAPYEETAQRAARYASGDFS